MKPVNGFCMLCHTSCDYCSGTGESDCTSCADSYLRKQNICVEQCGDGFFVFDKEDNGSVTQTCETCHPACKVCNSKQSNRCFECMENYFYHPETSTCLDSCAVGYIESTDIPGICVPCFVGCEFCLPDYVSFLNNCYENCPEGTKNIGQVCFQINVPIIKFET